MPLVNSMFSASSRPMKRVRADPSQAEIVPCRVWPTLNPVFSKGTGYTHQASDTIFKRYTVIKAKHVTNRRAYTKQRIGERLTVCQ